MCRLARPPHARLYMHPIYTHRSVVHNSAAPYHDFQMLFRSRLFLHRMNASHADSHTASERASTLAFTVVSRFPPPGPMVGSLGIRCGCRYRTLLRSRPWPMSKHQVALRDACGLLRMSVSLSCLARSYATCLTLAREVPCKVDCAAIYHLWPLTRTQRVQSIYALQETLLPQSSRSKGKPQEPPGQTTRGCFITFPIC